MSADSLCKTDQTQERTDKWTESANGNKQRSLR
jgi:hypothetical protein